MRLSAIKNGITSKIGRQVLVTQKHSPVLMFGVGIVGVVATAALAVRATFKLEDVLKEAEAKIEEDLAHMAKSAETGVQTDEDQVSYDRHVEQVELKTKINTGIKVVKLYFPAVLVGTLTVGLLTGSHVILSRRNVALSAAYAAVDKGFKEYRERVVTELGEEKDREFRYGMVEREMAVDTDEGVAVKTVKTVDPEAVKDGRSMYARIFDEYNRNHVDEARYNAVFLRAQQNFANDLLQGRGHVFLNDVYDMLGFDRTKAGSVVGWVKDSKKGDNRIDFGMTDTYDGMRFVNGYEKSVVLDFNVDGVIYDLLGN